MSKTAEIIAVGTELLLGNIANTDAQTISQALSGFGINVYFHTVVGDNATRLHEALDIAKRRADIIITTGGLGPTYDDLTKGVVAESFGRKLVLNERILTGISEYFNRIGRVPTKNNERQAWLPEGCEIFENDWGTAPGCAFEADGKHVLMLPGPPRECSAMLMSCAVPYLARLSDSVLVSRNIRVFGLGESAVESMLFSLMTKMTNPTVAPYAKEGEVLLRVTAKASRAEEAEGMLAPVVAEILEIIGDFVYGVDVDSLEASVCGLLKSRGKTLAVAESCTGGLIAKRLTDVPGASEVFVGGVCAYAQRMKTVFLGVPEEVIESEGVVSAAVAEAMARGIRERSGADIGVGVTGFAGPTGGEVGLVYVALCDGDGAYVRELRLGDDRDRVRVSASNTALDMVRRAVTGIALSS